jgi:hypothetical protein
MIKAFHLTKKPVGGPGQRRVGIAQFQGEVSEQSAALAFAFGVEADQAVDHAMQFFSGDRFPGSSWIRA